MASGCDSNRTVDLANFQAAAAYSRGDENRCLKPLDSMAAMSVDDKLRKRIGVLISESPHLFMNADRNIWQATSTLEIGARREAWLVSARQAIELLSPDRSSPYRKQVDLLCASYFGQADNRVDNVSAILAALLKDIDAGVSSKMVEAARGEVFEEFLDHANYYLSSKKDRVGPAGVIAGVVFEDTIRRACVKRGIPEKGEDLDRLITLLKFNDVTAARCRTASAVRNKATHAQWDQFTKANVEETIGLTKELIVDLLES